MANDANDCILHLWREALRYMNSYEAHRDPEQLDYLIYLVEKVYRMLRIVHCNNDVLQMLGVTLSHIEDLHSSCSANMNHYFPSG